MPQCSVPHCTVQGGHAFPCDPGMRLKWTVAIRRDSTEKKGKLWQPGPAARVCHNHFSREDYEEWNYYGNTPLKRQLKKNAVPHIFKFKKTTVLHSKRTIRAGRRAERAMQQTVEPWANVGVEVVIREEHDGPSEEKALPVAFTSSAVQTMGNGRQLYHVSAFSDDHIQFYTGLESYSHFRMVLGTLGEAAYELEYYYGIAPQLDVEDQFFLTLIKLRTHPANKELSIYFGINEKQVSNIFITWINFLFLQWEETEWWTSRELVQYYAPDAFKAEFPKTRVILDGTELPMKRCKLPLAQQASFSTYKNRHTLKVIVGASPGGLVTYVSSPYAGSTSDRQIVERSNLPSMCDPGDDIMADKGFGVEDLFLPNLIKVNIPSFFKKKNRISSETRKKDRKVASKRVHIERVIGLAKTYKILCHPMSVMESSLAPQITKVIFMLCNFRPCIMK